ncbi:MAG TPA: hypothetical protein VLQ93_24215, partial [Myxococcaceae bacterium]|nr:hypothetical protein [Myxococcaceae bacterium]
MESTRGLRRVTREARRLGALLLAALMLVTGCATGPGRGGAGMGRAGSEAHFVRLEIEQGEPFTFTPPLMPGPVRVDEEQFHEALTRLVLEVRLSVSPQAGQFRVVRASAGDGQQVDEMLKLALRGRGLWCAPGQRPDE